MPTLAAIASAAVAIAALLRAEVEYRRQGAQKRAERFLELRQRLLETPHLRRVLDLVETDDEQLRHLPFGDRRDVIAVFEEVCVSVNSRLIRPDLAHYMFGYYAIRISNSENFWVGINRASPYWSVFRAFVARMSTIDDRHLISALRPDNDRWEHKYGRSLRF